MLQVFTEEMNQIEGLVETRERRIDIQGGTDLSEEHGLVRSVGKTTAIACAMEWPCSTLLEQRRVISSYLDRRASDVGRRIDFSRRPSLLVWSVSAKFPEFVLDLVDGWQSYFR